MSATYPIRPVYEQVGILREIFRDAAMPDLALPAAYVTPPPADGWFATLGFQRGETVDSQVRRILECAGDRLPFARFDGTFVDPLHLSGVPFEGIWRKMVISRALIADLQGSPDLILYPGQFAGRHQGNCLGLVAMSHCDPYESFLSVADVLCMLLTHPERLRSPDDGVLLCGADRIRMKDGSVAVPGIFRRDGLLRLMTFKETDAFGSLVTPTAFRPLILTAHLDA